MYCSHCSHEPFCKCCLNDICHSRNYFYEKITTHPEDRKRITIALEEVANAVWLYGNPWNFGEKLDVTYNGVSINLNLITCEYGCLIENVFIHTINGLLVNQKDFERLLKNFICWLLKDTPIEACTKKLIIVVNDCGISVELRN